MMLIMMSEQAAERLVWIFTRLDIQRVWCANCVHGFTQFLFTIFYVYTCILIDKYVNNDNFIN